MWLLRAILDDPVTLWEKAVGAGDVEYVCGVQQLRDFNQLAAWILEPWCLLGPCTSMEKCQMQNESLLSRLTDLNYLYSLRGFGAF